MKTVLSFLVVMLLSACGTKSSTTESKGPLTYKIVEKEPALEPFMLITGTEGNWKIEITAERISFIATSEGESFSVPFVGSVPGLAEGSEVYKSKAGTDEIEIAISPTKCKDDFSKVVYTHKVKVTLNRKNYDEALYLSGCANYLANKRLNSVWTLSQIGKGKMSPQDFGKELPYIDLLLNVDSFTGFGGCNRIRGKFETSDGYKLKFSEILATKMACVSGNKESSFIKALEFSTRYEIKEGKLHLYNGSELQLVFTK